MHSHTWASLVHVLVTYSIRFFVSIIACMLHHHTHSYRCTESHIDFLQTSFRFIVSFILRFIVSHLSRLLKFISHFCHNFSHLFFVMCFLYVASDFYFHVCSSIRSNFHCYFQSLINLWCSFLIRLLTLHSRCLFLYIHTIFNLTTFIYRFINNL